MSVPISQRLPIRRAALCGTAVLVLLLSACSSTRPPAFQREEFAVSDTFSRSFDGNEAQTCEAARRALLSQGYVVTIANADLVNARKNFQPEHDTHVQIEFRVVCSAQRKGSRPTLAFVCNNFITNKRQSDCTRAAIVTRLRHEMAIVVARDS